MEQDLDDIELTLNEEAVLVAIADGGHLPISRKTGLSASEVWEVCERLMALGLIKRVVH